MTRPVRRIVTGHLADGRVPPPRRGTIFRIAEFPPGVGGEVRGNETVFRDFGIGPDVKRKHPPRHPAIHRLGMVFVDAEEP